jgi:serine/threonine-protein kinase
VTSAPSLWTADGRYLIWQAGSVFRQGVDGTGSPEQLSPAVGGNLYTVSPDGLHLVLRNDGQGTGVDLFQLALGDEQRVTPLVQTQFNERNAEISPDGRWLAYESDESGQSEIYVRPFPAVDSGKWQASTAGGRKPVWARDGGELFYYRTLDGVLMGARVEATGSATFAVSTPQELVRGAYVTGGPFENRSYDVAPDGRFLMLKEEGPGAGPPSIVVVQNWDEELAQLVPRN